MIEPIKFKVYGNPIAQPRHKNTRYGSYIQKRSNGEPHHIHAWKEAIVRECKKHAQPFLIEGPVQLEYEFWMPRPSNHYGTGKNAGKLKPWALKMHYHIKKPDLDNMTKALKDAITDSEDIWLDDCQVCRGGVTGKSYVRVGQRPCVDVTITPL